MTPMLALLFAMIVLTGIGHNAYEQSFNYYIKDQFHLSSAYNGTVKVIVAAVTILMNFTICISLQKKTDTNKTFLPVLLLSPLPIATVFLLNKQLPFFAAYVVYNAIYAVRIPLMQTLVANRATAENSNSVMGFYQSMNSLGSIFGAMLAGLLYTPSPMYPFLFAFLAFAAACLIGVGYVRKYRAASRL